jgi:hypothetical protein
LDLATGLGLVKVHNIRERIEKLLPELETSEGFLGCTEKPPLSVDVQAKAIGLTNLKRIFSALKPLRESQQTCGIGLRIDCWASGKGA